VTYIHDGEVLTSDRAVMVLIRKTCSTLLLLDRLFPNKKHFVNLLLLPGQVDGAARFELDLSEYPAVGRSHRGHGALMVLVNVTEALTGTPPLHHKASSASSRHQKSGTHKTAVSFLVVNIHCKYTCYSSVQTVIHMLQ
jgi:hypothetical protein